MPTKFLYSLVFLLCNFLLAQAMAESQVPSEFTLALNWKAEPQFGGFYAAQVHGIYEKLSLKVKIVEGGSGTPTIQMLGAKQIEFAVVSADEIVLAFDRGNNDILALFAVYQKNPQGIMLQTKALESAKVKSLKELMGKKEFTLLWQAGLPYAQFFKEIYKPLAIQTAPYQGGIGLLQNKANIAQQVFVTSEPLLAKKAGLDVTTFLVADSGYNPYTTVLAVRKSFAKANPEVVKKIRQAVLEGWTQYLQDPSQTNALMAKLNKSMSMETFVESARAQLPLIRTQETESLGLGAMTESRWQTLIEQLAQIKLIKNKPKAAVLFQAK